jgi:hypothetical protein
MVETEASAQVADPGSQACMGVLERRLLLVVITGRIYWNLGGNNIVLLINGGPELGSKQPAYYFDTAFAYNC